MSEHIEIRDSYIIDPAQERVGYHTLFIADGRIAAWDYPPPGWIPHRVIHAPDWITCPGLIDLSALLHETLFSSPKHELYAAASGGITHLVCPPTPLSAIDCPAQASTFTHYTEKYQLAQVHPLGALTMGLQGQKLTEMVQLAEAGCIGFSHGNAPLFNTRLLYQAMQYAATFDYPIWVKPQDPYLSHGVAHEGHVATRLGLPTIPSCAETLALQQIITLMRRTGTRIHICQLSSAEGVSLVRHAKAEGLPITADISAHHVHLCDIDIGYFNTHCHLSPPLRSTRDRDALHTGLEDGTIDAICSNHTPVSIEAKQKPFETSAVGATGIELLLPLTLHWANTHNIELPQAIAKITQYPAELLGLPSGHLGVGAPADICLFDPDALWEVTSKTLRSSGKNTPFLGMHLPGRVMMTLARGQIIYQHT